MSKDKKSFFEQKFGPKKNPKVEKAKDARKDKQFRKQYGNKEEKWEFQDEFDKSKSRKKPVTPKDGEKRERKPYAGKEGGGENGGERRKFNDGDRPEKKSFRPKDGNFEKRDKKPFKGKEGSSEHKERKPYANKEGGGERRKFNNGDRPERKFDKKAPAKKAGSRIFERDKPEKEVFYTEEDRKRIFGEEAFKDRVLKELKDEIDNDFDAIKKEKANKKKQERRSRKDNRKGSEDYDMTKYIDEESDYEIAYEAAGGKKWEVEKAMDNNYRKSVVDDEEMPLNKFVAYCGICSRRDAVPLIKSGKIKIDGEVCTEPGFKITKNTSVTLDDKKITIQKNIVYVLMNKPKGYITTTDDPKERRTVMDLVNNHIEERIFPVGRLDRNTTGLLLLTNDGELAQQLSHPKYEIRKIYHMVLDKNLSKADFDKIIAGIELEDGIAPVDHLAYLEKKNEIGIEIHSGKNRIVRRIFESCGYVVEKLDRVMYAGLTKKNIPRGKWRLLSKQEIINLKHLNKKK